MQNYSIECMFIAMSETYNRSHEHDMWLQLRRTLFSQHCHFPLLIINSVGGLLAQLLLLFCDLRAPADNDPRTGTGQQTLAIVFVC